MLKWSPTFPANFPTIFCWGVPDHASRGLRDCYKKSGPHILFSAPTVGPGPAGPFCRCALFPSWEAQHQSRSEQNLQVQFENHQVQSTQWHSACTRSSCRPNDLQTWANWVMLVFRQQLGMAPHPIRDLAIFRGELSAGARGRWLGPRCPRQFPKIGSNVAPSSDNEPWQMNELWPNAVRCKKSISAYRK